MFHRSCANNSVELSVGKLMQYNGKKPAAMDKDKLRQSTYPSVSRNDNRTYGSSITSNPFSYVDYSCLPGHPKTGSRSRRAQYLHHEQALLDDLIKLSRGLSDYTDITRMECMTLPSIHSPEPLKPTTLYDRAIQKHRLEKLGNISNADFGTVDVIPLEDGGKRVKLQLLVKTTSSTKPKATTNEGNGIPTLRYEHDGGNSRNLPGQSDLIRLLLEAGMDDASGKVKFSSEMFGSNSLLDLYGNIDKQLLDGVKRKVRRKKRELCNFCGNSPQKHQKWCVFYDDDNKDSKYKMVRSHTDVDIKPKKTRVVPEICLERSKTTVEPRQYVRPDLPDYSTLHRDVYIHALAVSRARRVLRRKYDFSRQLTQPFVFSYIPGGKNDLNKDFDEMKHIFGKQRKNIEQYYEYFTNKAKQSSK